MRFMLDLLPVQNRQEVEQVKACCCAVENPHNPFHEAVTDTKECRWMQMDADWDGASLGRVVKQRTQYCNYAS